MKIIFLSLVLVLSAKIASAVELPSSAEVYNAINVKAEEGEVTMGASVQIKTVGGLTCKETTIETRAKSVEYTCEFSDNADFEKIYDAINVPEVDARPTHNGVPSMGAAIFSKSVGGLSCSKVTVVAPGAQSKYNCMMAF